jgi:long-chain fatty acid transport protein
MRRYSTRFLAVVTGSLLFSQFAYAAAFQFYELGAPINSTAGVGQAALATDASISYYNPAGMALLQNTQFLLGAQTTLSYTNFSPSPSNTISGNNGSNAGGMLPGTDGYFVYNYSPKLKFGASLTMPYGGSLSYDTHWVGRYYVQQMLLYTLNLNPAIAYQINDWVAVGGGVSLEYANLYQTVALPIIPIVDGQATIKADNTSPGFNLGALLTPYKTTKIGIAYRSQIIHDLRGNISFMNIAITPSASTKLVMPANIIASMTQDINNRLVLLGELGWANWSSMVDSIIHVNGFSAVNQQNWHDTYRIGLGAHYLLSQSFLLATGASFDSSPTSSSIRLPDLPMDRQIRVGAGLQYVMTKGVNLGVSYEYLNLGNASINNTSSNGVLAGSYSRNYANVVQASLNVDC